MVLDVDVQSHPLSLHVEVGAFRIWLESARNMALALALSLSLSLSLCPLSLPECIGLRNRFIWSAEND